jgi:RNA polymerase sigma-70 factor, ECF subfamily
MELLLTTPQPRPGMLARLLPRSAAATPSFEAVVHAHQGIVRAFLRRLCASDAAADDVAQETFLHVRKGLSSYRGEGSMAWVLRIAYRAFLADRRKRGVADVLTDDVDSVGSDDRLQPDRTMQRDVRRALRVLTDDERVAVAACFFKDMTHAEAALAVDMPLGTLKTHIARAKELFVPPGVLRMRVPLAAYGETS